jgi:type II secretory ATPase GspE/PulE/Tfp pilus assembly ATPase PilB-like protein
MFRYNFVPLESHETTLVVAMADPSQLQLTDELSLLLGKKLQIKVATVSQIGDLLKRTEQSQRVLDQATEGFTLQVVGDEEDSDENIHDGEAHARNRREPGRAPGRYGHLHRARAPRQRHSHRNAQFRSGGEVPH